MGEMTERWVLKNEDSDANTNFTVMRKYSRSKQGAVAAFSCVLLYKQGKRHMIISYLMGVCSMPDKDLKILALRGYTQKTALAS